VPAAIRRIHSKYLGEKTFPKEITAFEIREFFTLSAEDLRAIRLDSNKKSRLSRAFDCTSRSVLAKAPQVRFVTTMSPGCCLNSGTRSVQPSRRDPRDGSPIRRNYILRRKIHSTPGKIPGELTMPPRAKRQHLIEQDAFGE